MDKTASQESPLLKRTEYLSMTVKTGALLQAKMVLKWKGNKAENNRRTIL
jgi:hypothetical protein